MIDTKALRSRVLDLAIQGKLTEQLESDGTAEELWQQIQAEKQRLIKEGKIKKEKPLPEISEDEIPFEIPENWKWVRWGEIVNIVSARRVHQSDWKTEGIPFYRAREIARLAENGYVDNDLFISEELYNELSKSGIPHAGDIMISAVGTLGKAYVVKANDKFYYKDASVLCIENIGHIIPEYLIWVMRSDFMRSQIASNSGGTTVDTLTMVRMIKYLFPLPPHAEQKLIVARVEEIFRLLDIIDAAQEQYAADAESLKAKLITLGIQGRLTEQLESDGTAEELYQQIQAEKTNIIQERKGRKDNQIKPVDSDIPFEIPANWKWIRFGETGFFRKGPFGSSLTKSMFIPKSDTAIKVYEQQHAIKKDETLGSYYISRDYFDSALSGFEVLPDDIIVSCAGTIGETYIMPTEIEKGIINQALMRITVVPSIDKQFFLYYFNANLKQSAQNESNGMAITNIPPFDVLKIWYFPLPPLAEQKRIAETLERVLGVL